jgi:hypothetical protein
MDRRSRSGTQKRRSCPSLIPFEVLRTEGHFLQHPRQHPGASSPDPGSHRRPAKPLAKDRGEQDDADAEVVQPAHGGLWAFLVDLPGFLWVPVDVDRFEQDFLLVGVGPVVSIMITHPT